jgi:hypothetical protein
MRRLPLVVVLVWLACLAQALSEPNVAAQQDPAKVVVYITRTGEKYHNDGCRYLRQSRIQTTLAEAAKRYGPCSVCKPPTVKRTTIRTSLRLVA